MQMKDQQIASLQQEVLALQQQLQQASRSKATVGSHLDDEFVVGLQDQPHSGATVTTETVMPAVDCTETINNNSGWSGEGLGSVRRSLGLASPPPTPHTQAPTHASSQQSSQVVTTTSNTLSVVATDRDTITTVGAVDNRRSGDRNCCFCNEPGPYFSLTVSLYCLHHNLLFDTIHHQ